MPHLEIDAAGTHELINTQYVYKFTLGMESKAFFEFKCII